MDTYWYVNTFSARLIQAGCTTTACLHVALHEPNSGAESTQELLKC